MWTYQCVEKTIKKKKEFQICPLCPDEYSPGRELEGKLITHFRPRAVPTRAGVNGFGCSYKSYRPWAQS